MTRKTVRARTAFVAALVLGFAGAAVGATHYPTGALCYDCHAVSRSKMVVGTHLIKMSQRTVDLGITGSSTPIRCLFCHETTAVSVAGRTEMLGVWDHFDASSTSKHPADLQSVFGGNPGALDCQDCHTGVTLGVVSDGAGNARVHGVDAATQAVSLYGTLIGAPANQAAVSVATCQNGACHDADGGGVGNYDAPPRHTMATATLNNGAAPTSCTQCHGDHNSYQNTSLIVLRDDGTTSNNPGDPLASRVTPDECGECHRQDDGGTYAYTTKGHGAATSVAGGRAMSLGCTACHEPTEPHAFSRSYGGTDPMRFKFAEGSTVSSLTQKNAYSICRTCHSQFDGKIHTARNVGCLDCHEPHGSGVGSNDIMVRTAVPADYTSDADGSVQGTAQAINDSFAYTYAAPKEWWEGTAGDVCDNQDCHGGVRDGLNGTTLIHPMATFMTSGQHSDGNKPLGTDCALCHQHGDSAGSWRAQDSCTTCHGQPPPAADAGYSTFNETLTPHLKHGGQGVGDYRIACAECHAQYPANHQDGTYQSVQFSGTTNPTGSYNTGGRTCATLYCHSNGVSTGATNATPVAWNASNWNTTNLACNACHGGLDAGTRIATGSHAIHLARAGITCTSCHGATVGTAATDATTAIADVAVHVNRVKNVVPGGSFAVGGTVAFAFVQGADTCSTVSCHGSFASVNWGAASSCANCHNTFGGTANGVAMPAGVIAKHSGTLANPDADVNTTLYNSHQGTALLGADNEGRCDFCHANTQAAYTAGMHLDGQIQLNSGLGYQGTSGGTRGAGTFGCTSACHAAAAPYVMAESGRTLALIAGQSATDCSACHGSGTDRNNFSGNDGINSLISTTEYNARGHGAKGVACTDCHDIGAPHDTSATLSGANPFRLLDQNGGAAGVQFSCTYNAANCHDGNPTASVATVVDHTSAAMTAAGYVPQVNTWHLAPACLNCHDPHGDGANLRMIQREVYDKTAFTIPAGPPPAAPTEQTALVFTDLGAGASAAGTSWADTDTPFSSLCQECHETADADMQSFQDGPAGGTASVAPHPSPTANPGNCAGCHKHNEAFKPSGCNGCHGSTVSGQFWPDGAAYPDRAGDHQQHIDAIYAANSGTLPGATITDKKNNTCDWCHPNPGASRAGTGEAAHSDYVQPADVHGDGRAGATASNFKTIAGAVNGVQGTHDNATGANGKDCSNVDCHYRVTTPTTGTPTADGDGWYQPAAVATCSNCHGSGTAGAALPLAHPQHVGSGAGQKAYPCTHCHPNNGTNMSHQTGSADWTFAATLDPGGSRAELYGGQATGSTSVKYGGVSTYGTCANVYCHIQAASPAWNTTISDTQCLVCHQKNQTAGLNPQSGLHRGSTPPSVTGVWHDDTLNNPATAGVSGCGECHTTLLAQATHADGTFEGGNGQRTQMGLFAAYTQTADNTGTCATTACHASARDDWAHVWTNAANYYTNPVSACGGCHGDWANGWNAGVVHRTGTGVNGMHGGTGTYDCKDCHTLEATAGNYTFTFGSTDWFPLNPTSEHGNSAVEINSNGTSYREHGAAAPATDDGLCYACHTTQDGVHNFLDTGWTVASLAGDAIAGCNGCHGGATAGQSPTTTDNWPDGITSSTYPDRSGAHAKHVAAIGTGNAACATCHPGNPPTGHSGDTTTGANQAEVIRMDTNGDGTVDYWNFAEGASAASGTNVYFRTLGGANDTDAYYRISGGLRTCVNVNCHGNSATPDWYGIDLAAPAPAPVIAVVNPNSDGDLDVSWTASSDAGSPPVRYDLFRANGTVANACTSGSVIAANLGGTGYLDSGLTNGSTYSYCVRAKDSNTPTPNTVDSNTASGTPTSPGGGAVSRRYYAVRPTSTTAIWSGGSTTASTGCGTVDQFASSSTLPPPGRGLLSTTGVNCGSTSTNNYFRDNNGNTGLLYTSGFYTDFTYAQDTLVTGHTTNLSRIGMRAGSTTADELRIYLAEVDPSATNGAAAHTLSTTWGVPSGYSTTAGTAFSVDMSGVSITVRAGYRLGIIYRWNESSTSTFRYYDYFDNWNADPTYFWVTEIAGPPPDTSPPTFSPSSGVAGVDAGIGGTVDVTWNAATDAEGSTPLRYTLYWSTDTTPFTAPAGTMANITGTAASVTGLANGTAYTFGVRATDTSNNTSTNSDASASVTPTAAGGNACTTCHGAPPTTGSHAAHATSDTDYTDCDKCHGDAANAPSAQYTTSGPLTVHNDGNVDMYFLRNTGETNAAWNGTTCTTADCHFNTTTPNWVGGTTNCASCHQYPPVSQAGAVDHDASLTVAPATLANFLASHGGCETCHGATSSDGTVNGSFTAHANYPAGAHADGLIRMNGPDATPGPAAGTEYDDSNGGCNKACHANDATYRMGTSATRNVNYADFGSGDCGSCHKAGGSGAIVTSASPHVSTTVGGPFNACTDCHPGNTRGGFHSKNADANVAVVANNPTVGVSYPHTVDGATQGFVLGGDATTGTTEAQICWNCHGGLGVSEWGANTDTNGAANNYNFGTLNQPNWIGATWTSAQAASPSFSYKSGTIASTHAANPAANAQGVDAVANIRCSYCHDVHNTAGAKFTALGQTAKATNDPSGKPFLRGRWMGNPYREDGAPQSSGTSYPAPNNTTNPWGAVPRGGPANGVQMGGYWIDQNSGNPASTWAANDFGGLCELCHGNGDGTFAATEINTLNQFGAQGAGWVSGTNGHVNSVQGASHNATATTGGSNNQGNNIFAGRGGATNQTSSNTNHPYMLFDGTSRPGDSSGGFRAPDSQWGYLPPMSPGGRPMDGDGWVNNQWNNISGRTLDLRGTMVNANYHSFPCSKCHNPHASRLPALMITNCLDTKHNTWDNNFQVGGSTDTRWSGKAISNWTSAQNCHRLVGDDPSDTRDSSGLLTDPGNRGWNTVTPW